MIYALQCAAMVIGSGGVVLLIIATAFPQIERALNRLVENEK